MSELWLMILYMVVEFVEWCCFGVCSSLEDNVEVWFAEFTIESDTDRELVSF